MVARFQTPVYQFFPSPVPRVVQNVPTMTSPIVIPTLPNQNACTISCRWKTKEIKFPYIITSCVIQTCMHVDENSPNASKERTKRCKINNQPKWSAFNYKGKRLNIIVLKKLIIWIWVHHWYSNVKLRQLHASVWNFTVRYSGYIFWLVSKGAKFTCAHCCIHIIF